VYQWSDERSCPQVSAKILFFFFFLSPIFPLIFPVPPLPFSPPLTSNPSSPNSSLGHPYLPLLLPTYSTLFTSSLLLPSSSTSPQIPSTLSFTPLLLPFYIFPQPTSYFPPSPSPHPVVPLLLLSPASLSPLLLFIIPPQENAARSGSGTVSVVRSDTRFARGNVTAAARDSRVRAYRRGDSLCIVSDEAGHYGGTPCPLLPANTGCRYESNGRP